MCAQFSLPSVSLLCPHSLFYTASAYSSLQELCNSLHLARDITQVSLSLHQSLPLSSQACATYTPPQRFRASRMNLDQKLKYSVYYKMYSEKDKWYLRIYVHVPSPLPFCLCCSCPLFYLPEGMS